MHLLTCCPKLSSVIIIRTQTQNDLRSLSGRILMPSNLDSIVPNRQCIGVGLEGHSEAILELFKWLKLSDNEKKCENMRKNCVIHENNFSFWLCAK